MSEFYDTGSAFQFQIPDSTEPGNPEDTHPMIAPHFRAETFFADFEKWVRNLYRCHIWHKCLNADKLDSKDAIDLQLTVAGGDPIDSPNLVAGDGISISTSTSDITVAVDIAGLTAATVANSDLIAVADIDASNAIRKVTALSVAQLATGGDVTGPASATDNAIARFDLTTGKLLQNSAVTVDDSGNISTAGAITADNIGTMAAETAADYTTTANLGDRATQDDTDTVTASDAVITQPTIGNAVVTERSTATNDDPTRTFSQFRASPAPSLGEVITVLATATDKAYSIKAVVTVRCTATSTVPAVGETATYIVEAAVKNVGGTASVVGNNVTSYEDTNMTGGSVTIGASGANIRITVNAPATAGASYVGHLHVESYGPTGT